MTAVVTTCLEPAPTAPTACCPRALVEQGLAVRAVHLIDLENLLGGPRAGDEDIRDVWQAYATGVTRTAHDLSVVGTSSHVARRSWFLLPRDVRRVVRDGRDGAELALIDAIDLDLLSQRFGRLVIASGDHEFVPLARAARNRGLHVQQVTGRGAPARSLVAAACSHSSLRLRWQREPWG